MIRLTHIGGPTLLVEVGGWRILTDPTFDPPGDRYAFGRGTGSTKLAGPAIAAADRPSDRRRPPDLHHPRRHRPRPPDPRTTEFTQQVLDRLTS